MADYWPCRLKMTLEVQLLGSQMPSLTFVILQEHCFALSSVRTVHRLSCSCLQVL